MRPNTNPETGICYTVFALNRNIDPDVAHDLWCHGTNVSEETACDELRAEIYAEAAALDLEQGSDVYEAFCQHTYEKRVEQIQIDEPTIEGESEGIKYQISWLGGAPMLWVFESPYANYFHQCSPCCPGACDGDSPSREDEGYLGYDLPADWMDES